MLGNGYRRGAGYDLDRQLFEYWEVGRNAGASTQQCSRRSKPHKFRLKTLHTRSGCAWILADGEYVFLASRRTTMADRDREQLTITCPQCKASGLAEVSTPDSMFAKSEGFSVDKLPSGFSLAVDGKGSRSKTELRHSCGKTFKL
jgi:hypothetical protein